MSIKYDGAIPSPKLEQLEWLRSKNTPRRPMITHTMDSYQIPCHNKTKSNLQIPKICQNFKFWRFKITFYRNMPSEVAW